MTKTERRSLAEMPIDKLEPMEGLNPRAEVEGLDDLCSSIREVGILQPILVGPEQENGLFPVIAGSRRFHAAREVGLKSIPTMLASDLDGRELVAALAENVQREDLSPIEEAHAIKRLKLKQADAASKLGKSERWIRGRMALLKLPKTTQDRLADGTHPLEAAPALIAMQKAGAPAAFIDQLTEPIEPDANGRSPLVDDHALVGLISKAAKASKMWRAREWEQLKPEELREAGADTELVDKLEKLIEKCKGRTPNLALGDVEDIDAARAYGCLFEPPSPTGGSLAYLTDPTWCVDRLIGKVEAEIKARRAQDKRNKDARAGHEAKREAELAEREERAATYETAKAEFLERLGSERRNLTDADVARIICLELAGYWLDMGGLGTERKVIIDAMLSEASGPEILAGIVDEILVARYASAASTSWMDPFDVQPFIHEYSGEGDLLELSGKAEAWIDDLLVEKKILPQRMIDAAKARAEKREQFAAEVAAEAEAGEGEAE